MPIYSENIDFQIISVLEGKHKSGFFSVDARPYSAFSLRLGGRGVFKIGGETLTSCEGSILYVPEGMSYEVEYSDNEIIVAHMHRCNYQKAELISVSNFLLTKQIFYEMLYAWDNKRSANYIKAQFYLLLDSLLDTGNKDGFSTAYLRCVEYVNSNFADPALNIDKLCRDLYVCRSTVQRAFNLNLGMSPSQYLTKLRIEKSLKILVSENIPVSEVSALCGFSDEKYFSRAFKKYYGFSPSEARKSMKV